MNSFQSANKLALSLISAMAIVLLTCHVVAGYQAPDRKESADPYFQLPKPPLPKLRPPNQEIDGWIQNIVPSKPTGVPLDTITLPIVENGSIIREKQKPEDDSAASDIVKNPVYKNDFQPPWVHQPLKNSPTGLQPIPANNLNSQLEQITTPLGKQRYGEMQLPAIKSQRAPQNPLEPMLGGADDDKNKRLVQSNEFARPTQTDGDSTSNLPATYLPNDTDFKQNKVKNEYASESNPGIAPPATGANDFSPSLTPVNKTKTQPPQKDPSAEKPASLISPASPLTPNDIAQPLSTIEQPATTQYTPELSNAFDPGQTAPDTGSARIASLSSQKTNDRSAGKATEIANETSKKETFEPGRVLALVGGEPIFVGDVLFDVNQFIQKVAPTAPESIREQQRPLLIKRMLPNFIDSKLLYVATVRGLPEQAKVEDILKQADKEFDEKALEKFMEQMNVKSTAELDAHLRLMGSSLRKLRRSWSKEQLVRFFLSQQLKVDTDVSHQEMLDYYQEHESDYTLKPRARWEQVMVRFDKFKTRDEARKAIVEIGNKIVYGAKLSAIAKQSSQGFHAAAGGQHDWTSKGALTLKELDQAIFETPVGSLSEIFETRDGFHIVRVLERDEATKKSFLDAQVEIKEKLVDQKRGEAFAKHLAELKQEIPVEIFDFDPEPQNIGQSQTLGR